MCYNRHCAAAGRFCPGAGGPGAGPGGPRRRIGHRLNTIEKLHGPRKVPGIVCAYSENNIKFAFKTYRRLNIDYT